MKKSKYQGKVKYIVLTVAPVDYAGKNSQNSFRVCCMDDYGILWIGTMSGRVNKTDTPIYFLCRQDAVNAVKRTVRHQKKRDMMPTVHHIIPIIQFP